LHQARRLLVVRDPVEGDEVCVELRTAGITCGWLELPSERSRTSPTALQGNEWAHLGSNQTRSKAALLDSRMVSADQQVLSS